MAVSLTCDRSDCINTTSADRPSLSWFHVERVADHDMFHPRNREWHFCSVDHLLDVFVHFGKTADNTPRSQS